MADIISNDLCSAFRQEIHFTMEINNGFEIRLTHYVELNKCCRQIKQYVAQFLRFGHFCNSRIKHDVTLRLIFAHKLS